MVNPFDKTFFRFLLGFSLILSVSFAIIFFVGSYEDIINGVEVSATSQK